MKGVKTSEKQKSKRRGPHKGDEDLTEAKIEAERSS